MFPCIMSPLSFNPLNQDLGDPADAAALLNLTYRFIYFSFATEKKMKDVEHFTTIIGCLECL